MFGGWQTAFDRRFDTAYLKIKGNRNTIGGAYNIIEGNDNVVTGAFCNVKGRNNHISGFSCDITECDVYVPGDPREVKKEPVQQIVYVQAPSPSQTAFKPCIEPYLVKDVKGLTKEPDFITEITKKMPFIFDDAA